MRDALQWFIPSTSVTTMNHYEFGKCGHTWSQIASSEFFVAQHERKPRELRKSHSAAATVPRTFFSAFGSLEKQTTNMCILVDGKSRNSNLKIWRLRGMFPISNPPGFMNTQFSCPIFSHVSACFSKFMCREAVPQPSIPPMTKSRLMEDQSLSKTHTCQVVRTKINK